MGTVTIGTATALLSIMKSHSPAASTISVERLHYAQDCKTRKSFSARFDDGKGDVSRGEGSPSPVTLITDRSFRIFQEWAVRQVIAAIDHHIAGLAGHSLSRPNQNQSLNPVSKHQNQIDQRPFRSRADQEREVALQTQYHRLAIPEVVAALQQWGASGDKASADKQMG